MFANIVNGQRKQLASPKHMDIIESIRSKSKPLASPQLVGGIKPIRSNYEPLALPRLVDSIKFFKKIYWEYLHVEVKNQAVLNYDFTLCGHITTGYIWAPVSKSLKSQREKDCHSPSS